MNRVSKRLQNKSFNYIIQKLKRSLEISLYPFERAQILTFSFYSLAQFIVLS